MSPSRKIRSPKTPAPQSSPRPSSKASAISNAQQVSLLWARHLRIDGRSYAYSTLTLEEKEIQELADVLVPYKHLSHVKLNQNDIRDVSSLAELPYLLTLEAKTNSVKSLDFLNNDQKLCYLQVSIIFACV